MLQPTDDDAGGDAELARRRSEILFPAKRSQPRHDLPGEERVGREPVGFGLPLVIEAIESLDEDELAAVLQQVSEFVEEAEPDKAGEVGAAAGQPIALWGREVGQGVVESRHRARPSMALRSRA